MKMRLTLISNTEKELTLIYDWNDVIKVYDVTENEERNVKVSNISVYEDQPIIDGVRYKIINAFSY